MVKVIAESLLYAYSQVESDQGKYIASRGKFCGGLLLLLDRSLTPEHSEFRRRFEDESDPLFHVVYVSELARESPIWHSLYVALKENDADRVVSAFEMTWPLTERCFSDAHIDSAVPEFFKETLLFIFAFKPRI